MNQAPLAPPLLDPRGARVVLGAQVGAPVEPLAPRADTLFGPRGACLVAPSGPLFVCDTGHHRVLVWDQAPRGDAWPADAVIGHADFSTEGRALLNMPSAVACESGVLALADSWNHRVLIWHDYRHAQRLPDVVLRSDLFWCYGVALQEGRLLVADTGNRRVLVWDRVPRANDAPPDRALRAQMRWPHAIACKDQLIFVADAGLGVLMWQDFEPAAFSLEERIAPYGVCMLKDSLALADAPASRLLEFGLGGGEPRSLAGQPDFTAKGENRWRAPARDSLCWPYGIAACGDTLVIADTGNNRVLLWNKA